MHSGRLIDGVTKAVHAKRKESSCSISGSSSSVLAAALRHREKMDFQGGCPASLNFIAL